MLQLWSHFKQFKQIGPKRTTTVLLHDGHRIKTLGLDLDGVCFAEFMFLFFVVQNVQIKVFIQKKITSFPLLALFGSVCMRWIMTSAFLLRSPVAAH